MPEPSPRPSPLPPPPSVRSQEPVPAAGEARVGLGAGTARPPLWRRPILRLWVVGVVSFLVGLGAGAGAPESTTGSSQPSASNSTSSVSSGQVATLRSEIDRMRSENAKLQGQVKTLEGRVSGAESPAAPPRLPVPGVVPNMTGLDLQFAQDTLQAWGFYNLTSHDVTGQDRFQLLDRGWVVVGQTPPPGTHVSSDQPIDLAVKKEGE